MNDKTVLWTELHKRGLFSQVERQKALLQVRPPRQKIEPYVPIPTYKEVKSAEEEGSQKVGALLLAGGVGSRLRYHHPKGCFPIFNEKSLYQLAAEKIKKGALLAIMTSDNTDRETQEFFEKHNFFGLAPSQVDFFVQESWPLLDSDQEPFFDAPGHLAMGPNGNGGALSLFARSPIFQKWKKAGIQHISLIPVDNPLADPFFAPGIEHHIQREAEITLLVTKKRSFDEKMGVIALVDNRLAVVEYSEIPASLLENFPYGNSGMMFFSMDFAERVASIELPMHVARKSSKKFTQLEGSTEIIAYKFEQFIFDLLYYSNRSVALVCDRAHCFAPLKELEGPDGVASVRSALYQGKL